MKKKTQTQAKKATTQKALKEAKERQRRPKSKRGAKIRKQRERQKPFVDYDPETISQVAIPDPDEVIFQ